MDDAAKPQVKGLDCKGALLLGTACQRCERCVKERLDIATRLESTGLKDNPAYVGIDGQHFDFAEFVGFGVELNRHNEFVVALKFRAKMGVSVMAMCEQIRQLALNHPQS